MKETSGRRPRAKQVALVCTARRDAPKAFVSSEFDALLARMQTPKARRGMKTAFDASGKQLGRAAAAAARRRD